MQNVSGTRYGVRYLVYQYRHVYVAIYTTLQG